jgi:hypothetical protein
LNANNAKLQHVLHWRSDVFLEDEIGGHEKKLLSIGNLYALYLLRLIHQNVTLYEFLSYYTNDSKSYCTNDSKKW